MSTCCKLRFARSGNLIALAFWYRLNAPCLSIYNRAYCMHILAARANLAHTLAHTVFFSFVFLRRAILCERKQTDRHNRGTIIMAVGGRRRDRTRNNMYYSRQNAPGGNIFAFQCWAKCENLNIQKRIFV